MNQTKNTHTDSCLMAVIKYFTVKIMNTKNKNINDAIKKLRNVIILALNNCNKTKIKAATSDHYHRRSTWSQLIVL